VSTRIVSTPSAPRKTPRQARSRATVAAVIEAAARVLATAGWAGFTTNRVAETAGVSIGSLYQYFPDKLALLDAVRRRHLDDCLAALGEPPPAGTPAAVFIAAWVDNLIAVHQRHPDLHRVLLDEAPADAGLLDPHSAFEAQYLGRYRAAVAAVRPSRPAAEVDIVAVVVSDAIDGVIHGAARRRALSDPAVHAQLVRMLTLYLDSP
jgi:AcrR family transcriptional regulator